MIGNIHLRQSIKGLWIKLLLLCAALFVFEMLFSILGTSARVQAGILKDMKDVPPMVEKMFGEGFVDALVKYGIIALGYIHPFMLIIFILFIFISASQMLTSEIGSGTIGFTLSKPVSRKRIYINLAIIVYSGLGLLALSAYSSSALGILLFHSGKLSTDTFSALSWNLFLLMVFIAGYVAIFAAVSDSGKKLFTYGSITLLVFYIVSLATPLWKPLDYVSSINPFTYYNPMAILMGSRVGITKSLSLIVVSWIMFAVGAWLFSRRDLSSG